MESFKPHIFVQELLCKDVEAVREMINGYNKIVDSLSPSEVSFTKSVKLQNCFKQRISVSALLSARTSLPGGDQNSSRYRKIHLAIA